MAKSFVGFDAGDFRKDLDSIAETKLQEVAEQYYSVPIVRDITKEWREQGNETWELVYRIKTKSPAVDIIIFSSIYERDRQARKVGEDRVRLVLRWKTKQGYKFGHLKRHNRIEGLYGRLEQSILLAQLRAEMRLNYSDFRDSLLELEANIED